MEGPLTVIDVETVPCADALALATRRSRSGHGRVALHRLVSVCALTARETAYGFVDVDVRAFAHPDHREQDMVGFADLLMPEPGALGATLATYNGTHDLAVLRQRACAIWMFDVPRLAAWANGTAGRHVDLMRRHGPSGNSAWSLADTCSGLGFAIRRGVSGRSVRNLHAEGRHAAVREHNMLDVVGTFLLYAYSRSFESGQAGFVTSAWDAIGRITSLVHLVDPDVQSLADHHLVTNARALLTGHCLPRP